jgi:hypothetical protein
MQVGSLPDKKRTGSFEGERDSTMEQGLKSAVMVGLGYFATGAALEILVYILEVEHSVDFNSIADNPGALRKGLFAMFGSAGEAVESRICQAIGMHFRVGSEGKTLEDLISMVRFKEFVNGGS